MAPARSGADRDTAEAAALEEFTAHVIASAARQSSPGASSIIKFGLARSSCCDRTSFVIGVFGIWPVWSSAFTRSQPA